MKTKIIFLVTVGDVMNGTINPRLSSKGKEQIQRLAAAKLLPDEPYLVIRGTGQGHKDTAEILGWENIDHPGVKNSQRICLSQCCGQADVKVGEKILTGSGDYSLKNFLIHDTRQFLMKQEGQTVMIVDQIFMMGLGITGAKKASIYKAVCEAESNTGYNCELIYSAN
ncbi:MAG: hypothetical protein WC453_03220 [Patescibacteria group bacterium]